MCWRVFPPAGTLPGMKKASVSERRRTALQAYIVANVPKVKPWAEKAGVKPNSIYNFLKGRTQSLDEETYEKLASADHVPVFALKGDQPVHKIASTMKVVGSVQAGRWSEAMVWDEERHYTISFPIAEKYRKVAFGLEIVGTSMNLVYGEGTIAICVNLSDFHDQLKSGNKVVVQRTKKDGLVEATVKELVIDGAGKQWLWPRSSDPQFQTPWNADQAGANIQKVEIVAVVVAAWTPQI